MELRNGKALSGLPPALAADAEAMRVAARDGEVAALGALLERCAASHGAEGVGAAVNGIDWGGMYTHATPRVLLQRGSRAVRPPCTLSAIVLTVDCPRAPGWTAMHYAAAGNRAEVIALLLSASGSPMSRDLDGWLPLHVACLNGAAAAAVQLLGHTPAAAAERSDDGDAAIDIARRYGAYYVEAA